MVGLVVGAIRMAMEFSYTAPACGSADVDNRPAIFANVHYLTFALILAAISFVVMILVSIVTAPRRAEQVVLYFDIFNKNINSIVGIYVNNYVNE